MENLGWKHILYVLTHLNYIYMCSIRFIYTGIFTFHRPEALNHDHIVHQYIVFYRKRKKILIYHLQLLSAYISKILHVSSSNSTGLTLLESHAVFHQ